MSPPNEGGGPDTAGTATTTSPVDDRERTALTEDPADRLRDLSAFIHTSYASAGCGGGQLVRGKAHWAVGHGRDANGKHRSWDEHHQFNYPGDEVIPALHEILRAADADDAEIYLCPYLMHADKRVPGGTVARDKLHCDWDGALGDLQDCLEKVGEVGGYAVNSGSPGHLQVYVRLAESVPAPQHLAMCEALQRFLPRGADRAKKATNDLMRPPGTFHRKGSPTPVTWAIRSGGSRMDVHELSTILGIEAHASPQQSHASLQQAHASPNGSVPVKTVDLATHPDVQAALDRVTGDRSNDSYGVVAACFDDCLTLEQTRGVVASRADLAERLTGRNDDDVLTSWLKVVNDRQQQVQITGSKKIEADRIAAAEQGGDEATTWEPVDLCPWLRGEIEHPTAISGIARSDGLRFIYPGREHAVLGETESGKTWFALGCVAAELNMGNHVVYIHYEEGDPGSTIERLRLLCVPDSLIRERFRFVAPVRRIRVGWIDALLDPAPSLVVHDGVNEAMALHGEDIMAAEGASAFRRALIIPCTRTGAATLACDHLPKDREGRGRDAYGSVHKGNALDGARVTLENATPFGRGMRGVSYLFVTKDRPGHLRKHGRPTETPGKTFMGTLVVDDSETYGPDFAMLFFAPKDDDDDGPIGHTPNTGLADAVCTMIDALPGHTVTSMRMLFAEMRKAGHSVRDDNVRDAIDDLLVAGRLSETRGARGARGYRVEQLAADLDPEAPPAEGTESGDEGVTE